MAETNTNTDPKPSPNLRAFVLGVRRFRHGGVMVKPTAFSGGMRRFHDRMTEMTPPLPL